MMLMAVDGKIPCITFSYWAYSKCKISSAGLNAVCICIYYGSPLTAAKAAATLPGVQQN
jgi:hypothetical protein